MTSDDSDQRARGRSADHRMSRAAMGDATTIRAARRPRDAFTRPLARANAHATLRVTDPRSVLGSVGLARDIRPELAALHHALQRLGDLAFLPVEGVEDLPQLVPPPVDLVAEEQ